MLMVNSSGKFWTELRAGGVQEYISMICDHGFSVQAPVEKILNGVGYARAL